MKLSELIKQYSIQGGATLGALLDPEVLGVTHNTEWVMPGFIFVAIRGLKQDAHAFIPKALSRGAIAVVGEGFDGAQELSVPYIKVQNARQSLGDIASLIFGHPSQHLTVVGVTGTKGKTTTTWLVHHLLTTSGIKAGLLSTVGYKLANDEIHHFPAHFTTPEAPQIQETLAEMANQGCTHAAIESSSHAIELFRLQGTIFDVAIWTNLAPEHLDFHGDMEGYFLAKRKLIDRAPFAIINADDEWGMRLASHPGVTYSQTKRADWQATDILEDDLGVRFRVICPQGRVDVLLPMIGTYNVSNALAAMAAAAHLGVSLESMQRCLESFRGVPGRMQVIQQTPRRVVVDFAHTAASLEFALKALRRTTKKRLIVVIGSAGGNRDPGKRAPLGFVATQLADLAIFAEEDSRNTPIEAILAEMKRGADEGGRNNYLLIADRREAIYRAIKESRPGDTVILAGKGPEPTLERANEILPWNEAELAAELIASIDSEATT